ncbi:fasciclin domain family protein, partial [Aspergillus sclerotialis]
MALKVKRALFRATQATTIVVTISLAIQVYMSKWAKDQEPSSLVGDTESPDTSSLTVWDVIQNERNLTKFASLIGEFDDIVESLRASQESFTLYAPLDGAFEQETFPYDLPWFYWKFLVGYHMSPGAWSALALPTQNTVSSFVNADIYFKNRQRISVQAGIKRTSLNYRANVIASNTGAVNGYVHHLDRLLVLPESASDILRDTPNFGVFRKGLIETGLAAVVNDTSGHLGQTLFVPSDKAFRRLGSKANRFLFGPGGQEYLRALLGYHIVSNETMFSDVTFPVNNQKQLDFAGEPTHTRLLTTLAGGHNISAASTEGPDSSRRTITINGAVSVTRPDIVVMDGVVHEIDSVLLPPLDKPDSHSGIQGTTWWRSLLNFMYTEGQ